MAYCTFAFETCVVLCAFSRYHSSSEFGCLQETVLVVSSSICLINFFFRLITSSELYDVTLLSEEGTELRCHKCILIARLGTYENLTIFNTFLFVYLR